MVDGAESLGRETAGTSDPRITPFGAVLRRTKLDELPQLVNVLRGEMSVVGPRPEIPFYAENYLPEDQVVLSVRPGITDPSSLQLADLDGLMEARGDQSPAEFYSQVVQPQKIQLQKQYIATQTLWGDVQIVLATIARIVRR
jgi:lipopolysaccharide/colanic/teichoic acid biosynthesis glycosyltransferase